MDPQRVPDAVLEACSCLRAEGRLVVLTGAGISAESGIPTFRGEEGYWTVGAREYQPTEMATGQAFAAMPDEVWRWYLYRRGVCRGSQPNAGHGAVVDLERSLGDRFTLVTQNVDGLHLRAGNSAARCYQIHGNIDFMRCAARCSTDLLPVPSHFDDWTKERELTPEERDRLVCPGCGGVGRPHVLWFDECYDEELFRAESSLAAARAADVLLVVGTSGATNLPLQVGAAVVRAGGVVVDINLDDNPFGQLARQTDRGFTVRGRAGDILPQLANHVA